MCTATLCGLGWALCRWRRGDYGLDGYSVDLPSDFPTGLLLPDIPCNIERSNKTVSWFSEILLDIHDQLPPHWPTVAPLRLSFTRQKVTPSRVKRGRQKEELMCVQMHISLFLHSAVGSGLATERPHSTVQFRASRMTPSLVRHTRPYRAIVPRKSQTGKGGRRKSFRRIHL